MAHKVINRHDHNYADWREIPSIVTAVTAAYDVAEKSQRGRLRSWMVKVLSDEYDIKKKPKVKT